MHGTRASTRRRLARGSADLCFATKGCAGDPHDVARLLLRDSELAGGGRTAGGSESTGDVAYASPRFCTRPCEPCIRRTSRSRRTSPAAPSRRGCRTNQTACTNLTMAVFADLVRAAQAAQAGPSRRKWFTPESSPCRRRTKSRARRWFVRRPWVMNAGEEVM
jgi:hypothetical protein